MTIKEDSDHVVGSNFLDPAFHYFTDTKMDDIGPKALVSSTVLSLYKVHINEKIDWS